MRQITLPAILLTCFWSLQLKAQDVQELPLRQALEEIKANNNELKAMRFELDSMQAKVVPASSLDDPMLSLKAANYPRSNFSRNDYEMTGNEIELRQKIPFPGKRAQLQQAARSEFDLSQTQLDSRVRELIKLAKQTYYKSANLHHAQDINRQQLQLLQQLTALAENKLAAGQSQLSEVLALRLKQSELSSEQYKIAGEIKLQSAQLNHLMGRSDHAYTWKPEQLKFSALAKDKLDPEKLIKIALAKNPTIKAAKAKQNLSQANLSASQLSYLPDFELMIGYTQRQAGDNNDGEDFVSAGIGINLPLWHQTKQKPLITSAKLSKNQADRMLAEEESHLGHYLHAILAELEEADSNIKLYQSSILPNTKQSVDWAESAYASDKIDFSSLINLINDSFAARRKYYEILALREEELAELEQLCGEALFDGMSHE